MPTDAVFDRISSAWRKVTGEQSPIRRVHNLAGGTGDFLSRIPLKDKGSIPFGFNDPLGAVRNRGFSAASPLSSGIGLIGGHQNPLSRMSNMSFGSGASPLSTFSDMQRQMMAQDTGLGAFSDTDLSGLTGGSLGMDDIQRVAAMGNAAKARGLEGVGNWSQQINQAAQMTGVPSQVIAAIMGLESGGRQGAVSPAGAQGLMQVMPQYHSQRATKYGLGTNLMDPMTNIVAGADYLKDLFNTYGRWDHAALAYFTGGLNFGAADVHGTTGNAYIQIFADNLAGVVQSGQFQASPGTGEVGTIGQITGGHTGLTQAFGHTGFAASSGWYGGHGHEGIDISVPQGTTLYAPITGTVIYASIDGGYGGTVKIQSGNMVVQLSHMSGINVQVGQQVTSQTPLGKSGGQPGTPGAGSSTGSHLHLGVYVDGQPKDPRNYFRL